MTQTTEYEGRLLNATVGMVVHLGDHLLLDLDCKDGTSVRITVTEVQEAGRTVRVAPTVSDKGRS